MDEMIELYNKMDKYKKIEKEYFETIRESTENLVTRRILTDVEFDRNWTKIGINKNGIGIYIDTKIKNDEINDRISQVSDVKTFKSIDFHKVIENIRIHQRFGKNNWKINILEIIADSLDQFKISQIPEGNFSFSVNLLKDDREISGLMEKELSNLIKIAKDYLESINNSNEKVLEKLKYDLNTILVSKRL